MDDSCRYEDTDVYPVGFVYKSLTNCPPSIDIFVSRNVTEDGDHWAVNLMVGWLQLILSMNSIKLSSPCGQIANTSSIYLNHTSWFLSDVWKGKFSPYLPIYSYIGIGRSHSGPHCCSLNLQKMAIVKREVVPL